MKSDGFLFASTVIVFRIFFFLGQNFNIKYFFFMDEIVNDVLNGAPLSKYSQEEQEKMLMPLALAKKEAQFRNKIDDVEKIDAIINRLQLSPDQIPAPIGLMQQKTLTRSGRSLTTSSVSFMQTRNLRTASSLRTVDSENDNYNTRYLNKERNRLIELRDAKRQIILDRHKKELEALHRPTMRKMEPYNELQVCTHLIAMKKEKEEYEKKKEKERKTMKRGQKADTKETDQNMKEEVEQESKNLVHSLNIKLGNEMREQNYQKAKKKLIEKQKDELEHFDREWYIRLLEFEGSKQEIRSFSQSLPVIKTGTYSKYLRTQNTFSFE